MAVIDEVGVREDLASFGAASIGDDILDWFRGLTSLTMWGWYQRHREDAVANVGFLFISYTVRVKHVRPLFVMLFGPKPTGVT